MENVWITLITVLGGIVTALVTYVIWKKKKVKEQELVTAKEKFENEKKIKELEERDNQLKELCNYIAGSVDILNQDTITVTPEIRATFREFATRYHSLDLVKIPQIKKDKGDK